MLTVSFSRTWRWRDSLDRRNFHFQRRGRRGCGSLHVNAYSLKPPAYLDNQAAAANVDRTQEFQVTWTGGNPGSYVYISGGSTSAARVLGSYLCLAPAVARQFTVPSYVLLSTPAGSGGVVVQNSISSTFSAGGLDLTNAIADVSFSTVATYR